MTGLSFVLSLAAWTHSLTYAGEERPWGDGATECFPAFVALRSSVFGQPLDPDQVLPIVILEEASRCDDQFRGKVDVPDLGDGDPQDRVAALAAQTGGVRRQVGAAPVISVTSTSHLDDPVRFDPAACPFAGVSGSIWPFLAAEKCLLQQVPGVRFAENPNMTGILGVVVVDVSGLEDGPLLDALLRLHRAARVRTEALAFLTSPAFGGVTELELVRRGVVEDGVRFAPPPPPGPPVKEVEGVHLDVAFPPWWTGPR